QKHNKAKQLATIKRSSIFAATIGVYFKINIYTKGEITSIASLRHHRTIIFSIVVDECREIIADIDGLLHPGLMSILFAQPLPAKIGYYRYFSKALSSHCTPDHLRFISQT